MRTSRRLAILVSAMTLASMITPAPASAAGRDGPQPLSNVLPPVDAYGSEWVTVRWTTDRPVCHGRVRMHGGRNVDVAYPGDRDYTSFSKGGSTSFRLTAHEDGPDRAFLAATVDYDYCRPGSPTMNDAIGFWLPVRA
jgi:hypothetical protein